MNTPTELWPDAETIQRGLDALRASTPNLVTLTVEVRRLLDDTLDVKISAYTYPLASGPERNTVDRAVEALLGTETDALSKRVRQLEDELSELRLQQAGESAEETCKAQNNPDYTSL